jgi:hypothetical protein
MFLHPLFLFLLSIILDSYNIIHNEKLHAQKYKILTIHSFWKHKTSKSKQCIVVTYFQFDSNIRVLYVFFGLLKKYLKILDIKANFQAFV